MDLHQLRIFVTVADESNLTRGAQRLFMTPPTVSAHLKALEDELGVTLFVRTARGMLLTEPGTLLKAKAEHILQAAQELLQQAAALQTQVRGHVRCGLNTSPGLLRVGAVVQGLQKRCPGITMELVASSTGHILDALAHGSMDIGYIFGPVSSPAIIAHCLGTVEVVVAAPRQWASRLATATWEEVAQLPWISADGYCPFETLARESLQQRDLPYKRVAWSSDDGTKAELVAAGVGLAILERSEVTHGPQAERLLIWETVPMHTPLHFAYATRRQQDPLIAALQTMVLQVWNVPPGTGSLRCCPEYPLAGLSSTDSPVE